MKDFDWQGLVAELEETKRKAEAYRLAARRLAWQVRLRVLFHSVECSEAYHRYLVGAGAWTCTCALDRRLGVRP